MLVLGEFAHQFASQIYPYEEDRNVINYEAMDEVTDPGTDFDRDEITAKCRHDAIISLFPEHGRKERPMDKNLGESWFTHVSVEIKNSLEDLTKNGPKMVQYLGATDYFFLGVPKDLLPAAVQLLQRKPLAAHVDQIGLIDLTKGRIVIMPSRQKEKDKLRQALLDAHRPEGQAQAPGNRPLRRLQALRPPCPVEPLRTVTHSFNHKNVQSYEIQSFPRCPGPVPRLRPFR